MNRGGLVSADITGLRGNQIEDEMFHMKDQNLDLKKQLNNQGDTTKRFILPTTHPS
jgi:hypothetical protein